MGTGMDTGTGADSGTNLARSNRSQADLCASLKSTPQSTHAMRCGAHNGLFIGSPGDAIHTKHPLHGRQTPASLMAF